MKKGLLKSLLIAMFMAVTTLAWGQSLFYEEPFDTNQGWTLESNWSITSGALKLNWSPTSTQYDLSAISPDIVLPVTAGDMVVSQFISQFSSQGTPPETFQIIAVADGIPTVLWSHGTNSNWGTSGGQDLTLSLAPFAGQTIQLKFRSTGGSTYNFDAWFIYNIKVYSNLNRDLAATSISGSSTPSMGAAHPYVVNVYNLGMLTMNDYTVKLMQTGDVELGSVTGSPIAPGETIAYTIPWTPTALGPTQIWGKVVLSDDENPGNNETDHFIINVMEEGLLIVEIGTDTLINSDTGDPSPYGTFHRSFRQQFLYKADELYAAGAIPGMIFTLAFNVQNLAGCTSMTNYKIRVKHTNQAALTSTFEGGTYATVWERASFLPTVGWNTHSLDRPFLWNGSSNLLVEIVTDLTAGSYSRNALVYYSTTSFASSLRSQSDSSNSSTATMGTSSMDRSNIRFSIVSLVGDPVFSVSPGAVDFGDVYIGGNRSRTLTIMNTGGGTLNIYGISIAGSPAMTLSNQPNFPASLNTGQIAVFTVNYTPDTPGNDVATVTITDNLNTRDTHTVQITGTGMTDITVGAGNQVGRTPLDFWYKTSLFETIYTADEMSGFEGVITGIKFYNQFNTNITATPVKIWFSRTTQTNLSGGWIPSSQMTLVFDGTVDFPSGQNEITIMFPEPYLHLDGGNLAMMVYRPMDTQYYSSTDYFKTQTVGSNRARNLASDSTVYDHANPTSGTLSGIFPKTSFIIIPGGIGHITGTVTGAGGIPLAGVQVNVNLRSYSAVTNTLGQFNIPNVMPDDYTVSLSRHGYVDRTIDIVVEQEETEVMNISMNLMPQVDITGAVLASDTGSGIAGVNINLVGYENYSANSIGNGSFTFPAVFANHSYAYAISAEGYTSISGTIEVGGTNYNMGDIILSEIAYSPNTVQAEINTAYNAAILSWNAPDPNSIEITESFEGYSFPPQGWSRIVTNNGPANSLGVRPTWSRFGAINISGSIAAPTQGSKQVGLWWDYAHQDEWLLTPTFNCPPDARLTFDTYATFGSPNQDHYFVKVSGDGGSSWTVLWDASSASTTETTNHYEHPVTVDLGAYAGRVIKLSFHAEDPPAHDGLRFQWLIDNIYIGNFIENVHFTGAELIDASRSHAGSGNTPVRLTPAKNLSEIRTVGHEPSIPARNTDRFLTGYKVWRVTAGQESNESSWAALNDEMITTQTLEDPAWETLPNGTYKWAVRAIYTAGVVSAPAFSNPLAKAVEIGNIVGFVRRQENNQGIAGAIVSAGAGLSATTNSSGAYRLSVPAGIYSVTASFADFDPLTYENIAVAPNQNSTVNFALEPVSNEDDLLPVTVTALRGNYPNPFNPSTTISYDIKDAAKVRLAVYNLKGQLVRNLVNQDQASGRYQVAFNGRDDNGNPLSSGIYLYRFTTGGYSSTRKMMLME